VLKGRQRLTNFGWNWWRAVLLGVACAVGCAGELDNPERFAFLAGDGGGGASHSAPPACVTALFEERCNSSVCHGDGAMMVDLISGGVQDRLIDQQSSDKGECGGRVLVSSTGETSLLMEKLTNPTCGQKMPVVGNTTQEELACVQAWVDSVSGAGGAEDGGS
jgi:hypothetical protein